MQPTLKAVNETLLKALNYQCALIDLHVDNEINEHEFIELSDKLNKVIAICNHFIEVL